MPDDTHPLTALLQLLADGGHHPPDAIAARLGLDRPALLRQCAQLGELGLSVEQDPALGIRLRRPLELLDAALIRATVDPHNRSLLARLEVHLRVDSTNAQLRRNAPPPPGSGHACVSETQSAGRGRHGRRWSSPAGGNLYLSLRWHYPTPVGDLSGLSLALGVAAANAIADLTPTPVGLKWPNDLVYRDRKLGGILVELQTRQPQGVDLIAGIGINTRLTDDQATAIDQPWTDLERITGHPIARNRLAGRLLQHWLQTLHQFGSEASDWQQQFARCDALFTRPVTLTYPDGSQHRGIARGIDPHGALLLETPDGIRAHRAGEARARTNNPPATRTDSR